MRVAVFDEHWATLGGGEKVAAGIGSALATRHDVVLLGPDRPALDLLAERLQLDLSRVGAEGVGPGVAAVERASADFDLFVNASYTSSARCLASRGLYYVHFPHPFPRPRRRWRVELGRRVRDLATSDGVGHEPRSGLYPEEMIAGTPICWSDGRAEYDVMLPAGVEMPVHVYLGRFIPHDRGPVPVEVLVDGESRATGEILPMTGRFDRRLVRVSVICRGGPVPTRLTVSSPTFATDDGDDRDRLGVPIAGLQLGDGLGANVLRRRPHLGEGAAESWLDSYQQVVANSLYTRRWIDKWWDVDTEILYPPVTQQEPGTKKPVILSVGRFFPAESGHSKKQLELVRSFRSLVASGVTGWELHLVGGCSDADRHYLDGVRAESEGLPVVFHVDAEGRVLRDLYSSSSIYWHAAGFGEDPDLHPDRFEHFGITTVEAMSAGAVPVVIGAAGQREVVEAGRNGFTFRSLDQLVEITGRLIDDPELLGRFGEAAVERADEFSEQRFAERVRVLVDRKD